MDLSQILYSDSPLPLVVHCTCFGRIQNQGGREAAIFNFESRSNQKYWMDISQISHAGSPWSLVMHCTLFWPIRIQDGRQAAILDFGRESLLPLFLGKYRMDLSQIS